MLNSPVAVRYFAALREQLGCGQEAVEPASGGTLAFSALLDELERRHGDGTRALLLAAQNRLAVNQELLTEPPAVLNAGDEIAFLPPVTGG